MKYIILILALIFSLKLNAQTSNFGTTSVNGTSRTIGYLQIVKYATTDTTLFLQVDSAGVIRNRKVYLPTTGVSTVQTTNGNLLLGGFVYNIFTGVSATWTLPSVTGNTGRILVLINTGSGPITLITNNGIANIREGVTNTASASIMSGESYTLINNGIFWVKRN